MDNHTDFESLYWHGKPFQTALAYVDRMLEAAAREPSRLVPNLLALLESNDPAVIGITFDRVVRTIAGQRFGGGDLDRSLRMPLAAKAREQLAADPVAGANRDGATVAAANHASAMGVLSYYGDSRDVPRLEQILLEARDVNVLFETCLALYRCLEDLEADYPALVEALEALARNASLGGDLRMMAVQAMREYKAPVAEAALIRLTKNAAPAEAAQAAGVLADRDLEKYRAVLTEAAARWPDPGPYEVQQIRAALRGDDA